MLKTVISKYSSIDSLTPRIVILKFFACGGRISSKEAKQRTGLGHADLFGYISDKGKTYHYLTEKAKEETYIEFDEQDFANEIDEIITGSKSNIYDELGQYLEIPKPTRHPIFDQVEQIQNELVNQKLRQWKQRK